MAKVPVTLMVDGFFNNLERQVDAITYSFNQTVDKDGQVTDIPRGGLIVLRMKAYNDGNIDLFNWMCEKNLVKDGAIIFRDTEKDSEMKKIQFKQAYCVNYVEHWQDTTKNTPVAHWEEITLSCHEIIIKQVGFRNDWGLEGDYSRKMREDEMPKETNSSDDWAPYPGSS